MALGYDPATGGGDHETLELASLTARTATGTGEAFLIEGDFEALLCECILTAESAGGGDTLTPRLQHSLDGVNWDDVLAFGAHAGGAPTGLVQHASIPRRRRDTAAEVHEMVDGALAAGTAVATGVGQWLRGQWSIVDGGGAHSFTFQLTVRLVR